MHTYMIIIKYTRTRKEEEKNLLLLLKSNSILVACLGTYVCNFKFHDFMKWTLLSTSEKMKFTD